MALGRDWLGQMSECAPFRRGRGLSGSVSRRLPGPRGMGLPMPAPGTLSTLGAAWPSRPPVCGPSPSPSLTHALGHRLPGSSHLRPRRCCSLHPPGHKMQRRCLFTGCPAEGQGPACQRARCAALVSLGSDHRLVEVWGVGTYLGCCGVGWLRSAGDEGPSPGGRPHLEAVWAVHSCPGTPGSFVFAPLRLCSPSPCSEPRRSLAR